MVVNVAPVLTSITLKADVLIDTNALSRVRENPPMRPLLVRRRDGIPTGRLFTARSLLSSPLAAALVGSGLENRVGCDEGAPGGGVQQGLAREPVLDVAAGLLQPG